MTDTKIKPRRLASAAELDIVKTFECGQCFRWNADENGVYSGIAGNYPARIFERGGEVYIISEAPDEFWADYFDLERDYAAVSEEFDCGEYLETCLEYGQGIRILRQEPWEALCSFIISQCNNIKRIKGIVERLCELLGEPLEFEGERFYSFPDAATVALYTAEDLAPLRSGYRAQYIIDAARAVASGELVLEELFDTPADSARRALTALNGVGDKVANCVVLFGLRHMEAFPIDVWMKRALKEHFPPDFDPKVLGKNAGYAQQCIFYYARSAQT